jgi:NADH:ubiquinone oxidoreductase subunit 3 (subunit A)
MKNKSQKRSPGSEKYEGGRKERTEGDLKWTSLYTRFFVLMALFLVVDQSVRLRPLWGNGLLI